MNFWNFERLKTEIAEYLGRDDLEDRIPTFVSLAEQSMRNELRLNCLERVGWIETRSGESGIALPNKQIPGDWDVFLEMRKLALAGPAGEMTRMEWVNPDHYVDLAGLVGRPRNFTVLGRELHLAPTPDGVYRLLMTYWADIPPLGPEQPTNDLLLNHPRLYLYGALVESAAYTRDSAPAERWLAHYQNEKIEAEYRQERARSGKQLTARSPRAL
jgi:hypothetical protein